MLDFAYIVRDAVIPYISKDAKHVLEHLASRQGDNNCSWPSTQTLADCTNISLKGVQRAINCLIANRLIIRESGKQAGRTNRYKVTLPSGYVEAWLIQHKRTRKVRQGDLPHVGQGVLPGGSKPTSGVGQCDSRKETQSSEKTLTANQQTVSKSVGRPASIHTHTPTKGDVCAYETPVPTKDEPIVRLPGGKYSVHKDYAAHVCRETGSSSDESFAFWSYNQLRGWPKLAAMSLVDIAKAWTKNWQKKHPEEYAHERDLRLEAKRRREEEALRAAVAAEQ